MSTIMRSCGNLTVVIVSALIALIFAETATATDSTFGQEYGPLTHTTRRVRTYSLTSSGVLSFRFYCTGSDVDVDMKDASDRTVLFFDPAGNYVLSYRFLKNASNNEIRERLPAGQYKIFSDATGSSISYTYRAMGGELNDVSAESSTYRQGDTVKIKIKVKNTTADSQKYTFTVDVTDPNGKYVLNNESNPSGSSTVTVNGNTTNTYTVDLPISSSAPIGTYRIYAALRDGYESWSNKQLLHYYGFDWEFPPYNVTRSFEVRANAAPNTPNSPDPVDGGTNVPIANDLDWSCSDTDGDTVYYTVFFENNDDSPDTIIKNNAPGSDVDPGTLDYSSNYYWQVKADDHRGGITWGPVWDFRTAAPPTYTVSGRVSSRYWGDNSIKGVTVQADAGSSPVITDSDGKYTLTNVSAGTRTITASRGDYWATGTSSSASQAVNVNGNKPGIDFSDFACQGRAEASISVDSPVVDPGDTLNVTLTLKNTNYSVSNVGAYLDLSFSGENVTPGTPSGSGWSSPILVAPPGYSPLYGVDSSGNPKILTPAEVTDYLISASREGEFRNGATYSFTIPLTVKAAASGTITLKHRGTIGDDRDPDSSGTGTRDQQGWNVKTVDVTINEPPKVTLEIYRISDTSGTKNSSNPGTAKEVFEHGDTVRVTLKASNSGKSVPVLCVIEMRDSNEFNVYDSHNVGQDNNTDSPLNKAETDYYSFDWTIPSDAALGEYDILGAIRDGSNWNIVYDTAGNGPNDQDFEWQLNRFSVMTPLLWTTDTANALVFHSRSEDSDRLWGEISKTIVLTGLDALLDLGLHLNPLTGLLISFYDEIPITAHGTIIKTYAMTLGRGYTDELTVSPDEEWLPVIMYDPGDMTEYANGINLIIEKKTGLFSWTAVNTIELLTQSEGQTARWAHFGTNLIVYKHPISMPDRGTYRLRVFDQGSGQVVISGPPEQFYVPEGSQKLGSETYEVGGKELRLQLYGPNRKLGVNEVGNLYIIARYPAYPTSLDLLFGEGIGDDFFIMVGTSLDSGIEINENDVRTDWADIISGDGNGIWTTIDSIRNYQQWQEAIGNILLPFTVVTWLDKFVFAATSTIGFIDWIDSLTIEHGVRATRNYWIRNDIGKNYLGFGVGSNVSLPAYRITIPIKLTKSGDHVAKMYVKLRTVRNDFWTRDEIGHEFTFALNSDVRVSPYAPMPIFPDDEQNIEVILPEFLWSTFQHGGDGETQAGYQLLVRSDTDGDAIVYNTGFIADTTGHSHTYIPGAYSGVDSAINDDFRTRVSNPLAWGKHYHWHVRYRDSGGDWSAWSANDPNPHQDFYTAAPPVISAISDQEWQQSSAYTGPTPTITGTEPFTWSIETGPSSMTIDSNGRVSWSSPTTVNSPHTITIKATNVAGFDTGSWLLKVSPIVNPPNIASIADHSSVAGVPYTGPTPEVSGTLPVTWRLISPPNGMTINQGSGVVSWLDPTTHSSPHTISIEATNSAGSDTENWQLTVLPPPSVGVLAVTPNDDLNSSGSVGGPFSPSSKTYALQNTGETAITWTASKTAAWVTLSKASGTLQGGGTDTVDVSVSNTADTLDSGTYTDTISFTNTTNGNGNRTRIVNLTVGTISDAVGPVVSNLTPSKSTIMEDVDLSITISATITDASTGNSNIAAGEYYLGATDPGAGNGTPLNPTDGSFNSPTEAVQATVDTSSWTAANSPYTVNVRGKDAAGNWGTTQTVGITVNPTTILTAARYTETRRVVAWGDNSEGQMIVPPGLNDVMVLGKLDGAHNLVVKTDGTVVAWGQNGYGETNVPAGLSGVIAVAGGNGHSLALKDDGTVVGWGHNLYGQATPPAGLSGVIAIAAGGVHSLALKSDGTVVAWGYNGEGIISGAVGLTDVIAISSKEYNSLALKADGTVVGWGHNVFGETNPPEGLNDVVEIAMGADHGLALRSDGTVVGWGRKYNWDTDQPVGLSGIVAIAAGAYHNLALKSDGTLVAWGWNNFGQTTIPGGLTGVIAIMAGSYHNLALVRESQIILPRTHSGSELHVAYESLAAVLPSTVLPTASTNVFRLESIISGTLTKNGSAVVSGVTTIAAGESLAWTPPGGASAGRLVDALVFRVISGGKETVGSVTVSVESAVVSGFVWNDLDEDGIQDGGEPGVGSVTVKLYSPGGNGQIGGGDDVLIGTDTTGQVSTTLTGVSEVQSITTNQATDWEAFTIAGETYLAVANNYNGTRNTDSKIYRRTGSTFVEIQSIPTNGAYDWEAFTIAGETYLAVANYYNDSTYNLNSKIYKWNGVTFAEVQLISTVGAHDWEAFTIAGETYLAVANSGDDSTTMVNSKIFHWTGSTFEEVQEILTDRASDWEAFTIDGESYLAVANYGATGGAASRIYKWKGTEFIEIQSISTNSARDWEAFTISGEIYLVLSNQFNASKLFKWNNTQFIQVQSFPDGGADSEAFTIAGETYLAMANNQGNSTIYHWNGSEFVAIHSITTYGAWDCDSFVIAGATYLAVANSSGNSNIYRLETLTAPTLTGVTEVQAIPTNIAVDWESFTIGGQTYLAVANGGNGSTPNVDSKIYKWINAELVEVQSIPTNGANDWEAFTIGAETYLAVANHTNGSTQNVNSKIYKWSGSAFTVFQEIPTFQAGAWESFTIDGVTRLAVANGANGSNTDSKIYKWNGTEFIEVQSIPTNTARDWEAFTIGGERYLALANQSSASKVFKWVDTQFVEVQQISTDQATAWEAFIIDGQTYLAGGNHASGQTNSRIYRWNGTEFTAVQDILTYNGHAWESFTVGGETYLAVANHYNGSTWNVDSKIYRWSGSAFTEIQSIPTIGAIDWESFSIGGQTYLAVVNHSNGSTGNLDSKIYRLDGLLEGGRYQFNNLNAGNYYLQFVKPARFEATLQDQGEDDNLDSDVGAPDGTASHIGSDSVVTPLFSLASGEAKENVDAGLVVATSTLPTVTLAVDKPSLPEDGSQNPTIVTATLSVVHAQPVTVNLTFSGSAANTTDYTRSADSIVIPAGQTTGSIAISAVQDGIDEINQTVVIDIDSITNATEDGIQQVIITIIDDDLITELTAIAIIPANPTTTDHVQIKVTWDLPDPCFDIQSSHVVSGNNIRIDITQTPIGGDCIQILTPAEITETIGTLSEGNYGVEVFTDNHLLGTASFSVSPGSQQVVFDFLGSEQQWIVPAGVTSIHVDLRGAQGGTASQYYHWPGGPGGPGGRVQTTLSVSAGEILYLYVGGAGSTGPGGFNGGGYGGNAVFGGLGGPGGGGGGASDIRRGGISLNDRIGVAGGGGGGKGYYNAEVDGPYGGGLGGGLVGGNGPDNYPVARGGCGGTQSSGGCGGSNGTPGSLGQGGTGGNYGPPGDDGGGGGGGYYGGGGGGGDTGGGGGGSSYSAGTNTVHTQGFQQGNGQVIIRYGETSPIGANIGDFVWQDMDADGVQDAGESGIGEVTAKLYQPGANGVIGGGDDTLILTTETAEGTEVGRYGFINLSPGAYYLEFVKPIGYKFSPRQLGGDNSIDSDADDSGKTAVFTVTAGENKTSIDAGLIVLPLINLLDSDNFEYNDSPANHGWIIERGNIHTVLDPEDSTNRVAYVQSMANNGFPAMRRDFGDVALQPGMEVSIRFYDTREHCPNCNVEIGVYFDDESKYVWAGWYNSASNFRYQYKFSESASAEIFEPYGLRGVGWHTFTWRVDEHGGIDFSIDGQLIIGDLMAPGNLPAATLTRILVSGGSDPYSYSFSVDDLLLTAGENVTHSASIGGLVWHDLDGDGIQDADEPGIGGVTVRLFGTGANREIGGGDDILVNSQESVVSSIEAVTEVQAIPTNNAYDWESFTIAGETYLAVANIYNGSTFNTDSRIYKWNGSAFVLVQEISTNGAYDWEAFTIGGDTYLAVANSYGSTYNTDSRIYKWNGSAFVEFQAIPTSNARDLAVFAIGSDTYLAVSNEYNGSSSNLNSKIYRWNNTEFIEVQSIPTNGALGWEAFTIGGETYLVVANSGNDSSANIDSRIYKWNGAAFEAFQAIATNNAFDWEFFTIGGEPYLAVANNYNGSTWNVNSKIYKWNGTVFIEVQSIPTSAAQDWESFTIGGETYLAVANQYNGSTRNVDSKIYKWNGSAFAEVQSIPTNAATDWKAFTIGRVTYLAVANSYNDSTVNLDSKIYRLDAPAGYSFNNLSAGSYYVEAEVPAGYAVTLQNRGGNDDLDSDISGISGRSSVVSLAAGSTADIDAGLVLPLLDVVVERDTVSIHERGSQTLRIKLSAAPTTGSITVVVDAGANNLVTVDKSLLTFDESNWNTFQEVVATVAGDANSNDDSATIQIKKLEVVTEIAAAPGDLLTNNAYKSSKLVMRRIPAGVFVMGSPPSEVCRDADETQHQVTLTQDFYLGVFEFTQKQWQWVMNANPSEFFLGDHRPVTNVSWLDVRGGGWPGGAPEVATFVGTLRASAGLAFDLPTEAQWEYACRAGTTRAYNNDTDCLTTVYQQTDDNLTPLAWYGYITQSTHDVGLKVPNAWGLYDMHGNVWEWCLDWLDAYAGDVIDPVGPTSGSSRVWRGGSWANAGWHCRSAIHRGVVPTFREPDTGFRLALPDTQSLTDLYLVIDLLQDTTTQTNPIVAKTITIEEIDVTPQPYPVVYYITDGSGNAIRRVLSDGTDEFVAVSPFGSCGYPAVSASGDYIAVVCGTNGGDNQVWVVETDGSSAYKLVDASWSATVEWVDEDTAVAFHNATGSIYRIPSSGGPAPVWISVSPFGAFGRNTFRSAVRWSADKTRFAANVGVAGGGDNEIFVGDLAYSTGTLTNVRRLSPASSGWTTVAGGVAISADGETVCYAWRDGVANRATIRKAAFDGSIDVVIFESPEGTAGMGTITLSPDGQRVWFRRECGSGGCTIANVKIDGTDYQEFATAQPAGDFDLVRAATVIDNVVADFAADDTTGDAPLAVQFTDTSTGNPTSWLWNFGDGATSTEPDPIHIYNKGGVFTVKLTAANAHGSDTETKAGFVTVTGLVSRIAFESSRDGNREIYVMDADGANVKRLTNHPSSDTYPAWSPDGSQIVFSSQRNGNFDIYVMDSDGSNQTQLGVGPAADDEGASWSPDGSRLAFHSERDGNFEIYVTDSTGSNPTRLTNISGEHSWPSWSPDGSRIAFSSGAGGVIFVMNADGSNQTAITNNPSHDFFADWSPDGSAIAFTSNRDGNNEVYVMNSDGTSQTRLTNDSADDRNWSWSPDGGKLAFYSPRNGNWEIYVMNSDGSNQANVSANSADDLAPAWSPAVFPQTPANLTRTTPASDNTPTFTWTATRSTQAYEVQLDNGAWTNIGNVTAYTIPDLQPLAFGLHTFSVRAIAVTGFSGAGTVISFAIGDQLPFVTLTVDKTSLTEDGSQNPATITATLSATATQDVTVTLVFSGTATLTSDYTQSGTSITIPTGQTSGSNTISGVQDTINEGDETVVMDIDSVVNATEQGTQRVTITIVDNFPPAVYPILYYSTYSGNQIRRVLSDGTDELIAAAPFGSCGIQAVSVSGAYMTISCGTNGSNNQIWVVATQGSVPYKLVNADWSAFSEWVDNDAAVVYHLGADRSIHRIAPSGGAAPLWIAVSQFSAFGKNTFRAPFRLSANKTRFATNVGVASAGGNEIFAGNFDYATGTVTNVRRLSPAAGTSWTRVAGGVEISADGETIYYGWRDETTNRSTLRKATFDAANEQVIFDRAGSQGIGDVMLSPDGQRIWFRWECGSGGCTIASITLDGSDYREFATAAPAGSYDLAPAPTGLDDGLVAGFVWNDLDRDGIQDAGEPGVDGVEVRLLRADLTTESTESTEGGGQYEFSNLNAGGYYLEFVVTAGYAATIQDAGSDDAKDSDISINNHKSQIINLSLGETAAVDAGLVAIPLDRPEIVVTGNGYQILNGDDSPREADNTDFGSIQQGQLAPTHTLVVTNTGNATLTLGPVNVPPGFTLTEPLSSTLEPTQSDTFSITLNPSAGTDLPGTYAGDVTFITNDLVENTFHFKIAGTVWAPASVGGFVWHDSDRHGLQDANEIGIDGVTIQLYRDIGDGAPGTESDLQVASSSSAAGGYYNFAEIIPGSYYLAFQIPEGYRTAPVDQGEDDTVDSDVASPGGAASHIGLTPLFSLASGETKENIDAGFMVNRKPLAIQQTVTIVEGDQPLIVLSGTDLDEDSLAYTIMHSPDHGILIGAPPYVTYLPDIGFHGADRFTFIAQDGLADSAAETIEIAVLPIFEFIKPDGTEGTFSRDFQFSFEWVIRTTDCFTFSLILSKSPTLLLSPFEFVQARDIGSCGPVGNGKTVTESAAPQGIWYPAVFITNGAFTGRIYISPNPFIISDREESQIAVLLSEESIGYGETATVDSLVSPSPHQSSVNALNGIVTFRFSRSGGILDTRQKFSGNDGSASLHYLPNATGEWLVEAGWSGNAHFRESTSAPKPFTVARSRAVVDLFDPGRSHILGHGLPVAGVLKIDNGNPGGVDLSDLSIELTVTDPDLHATQSTIRTVDASGNFHTSLAAGLFTKPGTWRLRAGFAGNGNLEADESIAYDIEVREKYGYAILCHGSIQNDTIGRKQHENTLRFVEQTLLHAGFDPADVNFLPAYRPEPNALEPEAALRTAIQEWALNKMTSAPAPLYLVFVNHGNPSRFHMHDGFADDGDTDDRDMLTPAELNAMIENLEDSLADAADRTGNDVLRRQNIVTVLGMCYSGSFIPGLRISHPSGWQGHHIVVAAATENELSVRGPGDDAETRQGEYFVQLLFAELGRGLSLLDSFNRAKDVIKVVTADVTLAVNASNSAPSRGKGQHPLLDDNGDGVGHYRVSDSYDDGPIAARISLANPTNAPRPIKISRVSPSVFLSPTDGLVTTAGEAKIWAEFDTHNPSEILAIRMQVKEPAPIKATADPMQFALDFVTEAMDQSVVDVNGDGIIDKVRYTWPRNVSNPNPNNLFTAQGSYQVFFYAYRPDDPSPSEPRVIQVYRVPADAPALPELSLEKPAPGEMIDYSINDSPTEIFTWQVSAATGSGGRYIFRLWRDAERVRLAFESSPLSASFFLLYPDTVDNGAYWWDVVAVDTSGNFRVSNESPREVVVKNTNHTAGYISGVVVDDRGNPIHFYDPNKQPNGKAQLLITPAPDDANVVRDLNHYTVVLYSGQVAYDVRVQAQGHIASETVRVVLTPNIVEEIDFMLIREDLGTVQVTIHAQEAVDAGAQWKITGSGYDTGFQNSGVLLADVRAGEYTLTFKTVPGWITPAARPITVTAEQISSVAADYFRQPQVRPVSLHFGDTSVGQARERTLSVSNPNDTAIMLPPIVVNENGFSGNLNAESLGALQTVFVPLTFLPLTSGSATTSVTIAETTVTLSGVGTANPNLLSVGNYEHVLGGNEVFTVAVELASDVALATLAFHLNFPQTELSAIGYRNAGRAVVQPLSGGIDSAAGRVTISMGQLSGETAIPVGNGKIVEIDFRLLPEAQAGTFPLPIANVNNVFNTNNLQPVVLAVQHGELSVDEGLIGDVDVDGQISALDAIFIFRTVTSLSPIPQGVVNPGLPSAERIAAKVNSVFGDFNGDGVADARDAIAVYRHAAHLPPLGGQRSVENPAYAGSTSNGARSVANHIEIQNTQGAPGEFGVIARIFLNTNVDLATIAFAVRYDASLFHAVEYRKAGRASSDPQSGGIDHGAGLVTLAIGNLTGIAAIPAGEGPVAEIEFAIVNDAVPGAYPLTITNLNNVFSTHLAPIDLASADGVFTVNSSECEACAPAETGSVDDWTIALDVDNADVTEVRFGMRADASNGFDDGSDITSSAHADVYLLKDATRFGTDIRASGSQDEWLLVVEPGVGEIVLTWSNMTISDDKYLSMYEVDAYGIPLRSIAVSMDAEESATIRRNQKRFFTLRFASDARAVLVLVDGWNLISLPIMPTSPSVNDVFGAGIADGVPSDESQRVALPGSVWSWLNDSFVAVSVVEALRGYWVYFDRSASIVIDGIPTAPDGSNDLIVELEEGWNLYGPIRPKAVTYPLAAPLRERIWWWDGKQYQQASTMDILRGHWINSSQDGASFNLAK